MPDRDITAAIPPGALGIPVAKAEMFRVLGHPARIRILELLRDGERTVGELQAALGMDSGGTSQHLGVLRRNGIVEGRRAGTSVHYRAKDPRIFQLLAIARQILTTSLQEAGAQLTELAAELSAEDARRPAPPETAGR